MGALNLCPGKQILKSFEQFFTPEKRGRGRGMYSSSFFMDISPVTIIIFRFHPFIPITQISRQMVKVLAVMLVYIHINKTKHTTPLATGPFHSHRLQSARWSLNKWQEVSGGLLSISENPPSLTASLNDL